MATPAPNTPAGWSFVAWLEGFAVHNAIWMPAEFVRVPEQLESELLVGGSWDSTPGMNTDAAANANPKTVDRRIIML